MTEVQDDRPRRDIYHQLDSEGFAGVSHLEFCNYKENQSLCGWKTFEF